MEQGAVKATIDTDIGGDVDDALALAFALNSPELDLLAVNRERFERMSPGPEALVVLHIFRRASAARNVARSAAKGRRS